MNVCTRASPGISMNCIVSPDPRPVPVKTLVIGTSCKPSAPSSSTRDWKSRHRRPPSHSSVAQVSDEPFFDAKSSNSLPMETPMMCSRPSICMSSFVQAQSRSSSSSLQVICVPTKIFAPLSCVNFTSAFHDSMRSPSGQALSHDRKSRSDFTGSPSFGQALGILEAQPLQVESSRAMPFLDVDRVGPSATSVLHSHAQAAATEPARTAARTRPPPRRARRERAAEPMPHTAIALRVAWEVSARARAPRWRI
mmetsp:Transcript_28819/g.81928  ORF Transcript_28819/g.81928 Transcript_28819/m.81928 type:complete len:252 (-) Transcript_28819:10-765(-)